MKKMLMLIIIFSFNALFADQGCINVCSQQALSCKIRNDNEPKNELVSIEIRQISAEDLLEKIKRDENILIVNVLGKRYHQDAHIQGSNNAQSINAPLRIFNEEAVKWEKQKEIIVYCACRECDASEKAYKILISMGFTNVWAYEGGIREWYKKGYPCVGPCKEPYLELEGDSRYIAGIENETLKKLIVTMLWDLRIHLHS